MTDTISQGHDKSVIEINGHLFSWDMLDEIPSHCETGRTFFFTRDNRGAIIMKDNIETIKKSESCPACNGNGLIIKSGHRKLVHCPSCDGKGTL
jgi:hypothetical protein